MSHPANDTIIDNIRDRQITCTCTELHKQNIIGCCEWCEFKALDGPYDEDYNNSEEE